MKRPKLIQAQPEHIPLKQLEDPIPLIDLVTPPLLPAARLWLKRHGCQISDNAVKSHIFFPDNTTQARQFPTAMSERWVINLPDGSKCARVYDVKQGLNCLLIPITD